jgi:hypothetical protein
MELFIAMAIFVGAVLLWKATRSKFKGSPPKPPETKEDIHR